MPAQARYTLMIPQKDNVGQPLGDIATAAHHYLHYGPGPKVEGSFIHRNLQGNWRDDPSEMFDHLVTVAHDTPEMDSTIKQLGKHIAEVANQWGLFTMKEGKNGIQSWIVPNPGYTEGQGADPAILQPDHRGDIIPINPAAQGDPTG